jgi:radical SAM superfamily enzyme YgiQ (UPF0313 family)
MDELRYLRSSGIKEIWFSDFTFAAQRRHAIELCQRMSREKMEFTWTCQTRADVIDEELLGVMKGAGCHTILIGVETANEEILKEHKKNIDIKKVRAAFSICRSKRIKTMAYFIIGFPKEDRGSILDTINFAKELNPDYASFSVATPDMGTQLRREAIENNWYDPQDKMFDSSLLPVIDNPTLSKEEIWRLRNRAYREFYLRPRYLWQRALGFGSLDEMQGLLSNGVALFKNLAKHR